MTTNLPTSDLDLRCQVNFNAHSVKRNAQGKYNYPPEGWVHLPLVTDLAVERADHKAPEGMYQEVLDIYKQYNPEALVGTYISGGRVEVVRKKYPFEAIHASHMMVNWLRPDTNRIDLSNPRAVVAFAGFIVAECQLRKRPIVFLDNIIHPSAMRGWYSWEDTCRFLRRVKEGVNANGSLLLPNIAVAPWGMSDKDVDMLSEVVDGMSFEMPFHELARDNRERTARQITVYRKWLDQGKVIVLIALTTSKRKTIQEREAKFIAALAMLLREPGDSIFVAWPFWAKKPAWSSYPQDFGQPIGPHKFKRDHVLTRSFEKGTLRVNTRNARVKAVFRKVV